MQIESGRVAGRCLRRRLRQSQMQWWYARLNKRTDQRSHTARGRQTMDTVITGGCLCRAVRYRVTAAPMATRVCWCRVCQYLGAGSGTVNVCFPTNAMTIEGETRDYPS